jgi:hypothetical protein
MSLLSLSCHSSLPSPKTLSPPICLAIWIFIEGPQEAGLARCHLTMAYLHRPVVLPLPQCESRPHRGRRQRTLRSMSLSMPTGLLKAIFIEGWEASLVRCCPRATCPYPILRCRIFSLRFRPVISIGHQKIFLLRAQKEYRPQLDHPIETIDCPFA